MQDIFPKTINRFIKYHNINQGLLYLLHPIKYALHSNRGSRQPASSDFDVLVICSKILASED